MLKKFSYIIKGSLIFTCLALSTVSFTNSYFQNQTEIAQTSIAEKQLIDKSQDIKVDFREVAKKAIPAVVSIKVQSKKKSASFLGSEDDSEDPFDNFWKYFSKPRGSKSEPAFSGQASGVIVSADGYVITNNHVVNEMDNIVVQMSDGREFPGKVIGQDKNSDLALVKIEANDLPYLKLGNSDELEVGQWVAAIGNPFGLQGTLTHGVVSAKGRNNLDIVPSEDFIQTDASINSGNSGGPLVTLSGEVIGINTAIATNSSSGNMGIGFAIPSNMARYVMKEILDHGKVSRGYLGVSLQSIDYNLAKAFDLKKIEGALVTSVVSGSPADKAGIKAEDIIIKYNDRPVDNAATLRNSVYMMHTGTKINLTILRDGKTIQVPLEIKDFPEDLVKHASIIENSQLGIEVDTLTPELGQALGYTNTKGVVITKVQPGSAAALVGLKKGALILSVNRKKVETKEQFFAALKETAKDRPALLQIKQGDINAYISIQLE
ncbi:MAG: DegQ family serine endoprotease [Parachlamydiaceae bacterium]|nr:DegQ family serine endoprotease [Parachlamydiaceae bacterium]